MRQLIAGGVAVACIALVAGCGSTAQGLVTIERVSTATSQNVEDLTVGRQPDCSSNRFALSGKAPSGTVVMLRTADKSSDVKPFVSTAASTGTFYLVSDAPSNGYKTRFEVVIGADVVVANVYAYGVGGKECDLFM